MKIFSKQGIGSGVIAASLLATLACNCKLPYSVSKVIQIWSNQSPSAVYSPTPSPTLEMAAQTATETAQPCNTPTPYPVCAPSTPTPKAQVLELYMPGQNQDLWDVCGVEGVPDYTLGVDHNKGNIADLVEQGYVFHSRGTGPDYRVISDGKFVENHPDWLWVRALPEYAGQKIPELSIYGVSPDGKLTNEIKYIDFQMPVCRGPSEGQGQEPCPGCTDPIRR